jgi:hypothetical protein
MAGRFFAGGGIVEKSSAGFVHANKGLYLRLRGEETFPAAGR